MEIVSKEACDEQRGRSPLQWARHAFPYYPKCDLLLNNLCEIFNSKIMEAREKSLVNLLETIRRYLMVRIRKNTDSMAKYQGPICHKIQQKLEKCKEASIDCKSIWSSGTRWEVNSCGKQFVVDVEKRSCAYNCQDLTRIPCKHEVHVIAFKKERTEDYVHDLYKRIHILLYIRISFSHAMVLICGWMQMEMQYFLQSIKFNQGGLRLIEEEWIKMKFITLTR